MPPRLERLWRDVPGGEGKARELAGRLHIPVPAARVLSGRGLVEDPALDRFLRPRLSDLGDPFLLPGMDRAVARILAALRAHERIVVFGDYDVDGLTSTALMTTVLAELGADVRPFLPQRMEEGYGMSLEAFTRCRATLAPRLIVTVDCGTGSVEAVREATACGIDVVVTDHHAPGPAVAPAVAVVNPQLGAPDGLRVLAGVGIAFKVCHALVKEARRTGCPGADAVDLRAHLDLVALGTLTDIVPLTGENRIFVRHGLQAINAHPRPGVAALRDVAGIKGAIDAYEVGYLIGPRLNAVGRLGDALEGLALLLEQEGPRVRALAAQLDQANRERREIEQSMTREALEEAALTYEPGRDHVIVVAREGWHPGVVGIVASRLVGAYHRPSVVIAIEDGVGRGSCRSIEGFDMVEALSVCSPLLRKHGGHAMAAGLEVEAASIPAFREALCKVAADRLRDADLRPVQRIDAWMDLAEADDALVDALEQMKPFGVANATPVFASRSVRLAEPARVVGERHLKLQLAAGGVQRSAIAFGMADRAVPEGSFEICYQVRRETWNGRTGVSLVVQDIRPEEAAQGG